MSALHPAAVLVALVSSCALAGSAAYPPVIAGQRIEFPRDEGSHPEFRTEWWYVTGWLEDETGHTRGFQITFFRVRPGIDEENPSAFAAKQVLFAHVAVSDPRIGTLLRDEKSARVGFGLADAKTGLLDVAIDGWSLRSTGAARYAAVAVADGFSMQLDFEATQPPLPQGLDGFSQKSADPLSASYYYSLPQLRASGQIRIGKRSFSVLGTAWLDHEWWNSYMDDRTQGWDWLGLNLDDGGALMVLHMRDEKGEERWATATSRNSRGDRSTFDRDAVAWRPLRRWRSPHTGIEYPVEWQVRVGERTIRLQPLFDDQENDARGSTGTIYWEGAVRALDESGRRVGRGYLELTGYGERLRY